MSTAKKLAVVALAIVMVFGAFGSVKAQTTSDLQAQIAALLAQINSLQSQLTTTKTNTLNSYNFTKDLTLGSKGSDVSALQQMLIDGGFLKISAPTGTFGPMTKVALGKWQASVGISPTSGYFGPKSRAFLASSTTTTNTTTTTTTTTTTNYPAGCTSNTGFSSTTGASCAAVAYPAGCTSNTGFSSTTGLSCVATSTAPSTSTYGTLSTTNYPVSSNSTLYGAQSYDVVAAQYKASGSNVTVKKVAVEMTGLSTFPWSLISSISVKDGSTVLATVPVNQANLIENTFGSDYTLNVSGLNFVIPNGSQKVLTVNATMVPILPSSAGSIIFTINKSGLIYTDVAGTMYTSGDNNVVSSSYALGAGTQTATFTMSLDSANPLENNIIGLSSGTSEQTVLVFDVTNNSQTSATFNNAYANVYNSTADVISYKLYDNNGTLLQTVAAPTASTTYSMVTFPTFSSPVSVPANTIKTFILKAVVGQLTLTDGQYTGAGTIRVQGVKMVGIDANSNLATVNGLTTLTGNIQHIAYIAPTFSFVSAAATVTGSAPSSSPAKTNDIADVAIKFTVKANNGDIFIPSAVSSSTAILGVTSPALTGSSSQSFSWSGDSVADQTSYPGFWRIPSGMTSAFTLANHIVNTGPTSTPTYYQDSLKSVVWSTVATTSTASTTAQVYGFNTFQTTPFYLGQ
jgi:hypothetical protein